MRAFDRRDNSACPSLKSGYGKLPPPADATVDASLSGTASVPPAIAEMPVRAALYSEAKLGQEPTSLVELVTQVGQTSWVPAYGAEARASAPSSHRANSILESFAKPWEMA